MTIISSYKNTPNTEEYILTFPRIDGHAKEFVLLEIQEVSAWGKVKQIVILLVSSS